MNQAWASPGRHYGAPTHTVITVNQATPATRVRAPPASTSGGSGQVRRAGVDVLGVGQDVDEVRHAGVEGPAQGGAEVAGLLDGLAGAAEGLDDVVVAQAGLEVGGDVVAVHHLHRVLLQAPDAVVAQHDDDGEILADEGLDVHEGK